MDYNETLCQAIDIIVAQRISEVNFDRTILCTITDDSKKDTGEYTVTDGSMTFQACAETDRYYKNNQVYVQIPMGDFSNRKLIVGRHSTEDDEKPLAYVSPLEKIIMVKENLAANTGSLGLKANGEIATVNIATRNLPRPTTPYDVFYIKADFKSLLQDYLVTSGSYGIKVLLNTDAGDTIALGLDCQKDMFGNPYGYTGYSTQSQTYRLNLESDIKEISAVFYQDGNFNYYNGIETARVPSDIPADNILVKNIEIGFAYDASLVEDNTVKLTTANALTYNNITDTNIQRKLSLTWYNKDENNKYLGFADGAFDTLSAAQTAGEKKYYIKWEHSLNNGQWEEVQETGQEQELTVNLNMTWALNEYRAIVVFDGATYTSNIIQFKNATGIDNPQEKLQMSLTLHNVEDSSYDSYPLYGPDGVIINPLDSSKNRKVYFSYESEIGGSLESSVLNGATAYFYIPQNSTMLEAPGGETNWDDNQDKKHNKIGYTTYVKRFAEDLSEVTLEAKTFLYRVKKNYNPLFTNNSVILRIVDKNGFIYETSKTFAFSSYGTSGTDYSIIISGADGGNGWVGSNGFTPKAQLYDANYKEITDIDWTWSKYPTGTTISANQSLSSTTTLYQAIKAQTTVSWVGKNVQISGIYPISYSSHEDHMYQGPTTIIYNNSGIKPVYYDGELGLFKKSDNTEVACSWSIDYYQFDSKEKTLNVISGEKWESWGKLTAQTNKAPRFKPSPMYLGEECQMVLVAKSGNKILWRQPLIILQNQYASGLLNNWDGNLIVDNEGNYILSSMIGAGKKEDDNTFTGVLMGEVGKVDKSETGLFGYDHGAQSFGFKKDGTAFIGKSGAGRIEFNGNSGIIKSAMYNGNTDYKSGSKWDLANGSIILNGSGGEYFKFNEKNDGKLEMKISGANIILEDDQTLNSSVAGQISASAQGLTTEFKKIANYTGTCATTDGTNPKIISNTDITGTLGKGLSVSVTFTHANTKTTSGLKFKIGSTEYLVKDSPKWEAKETLSFVYDGTQFIMDSLSSSKITQTAEAISLRVEGMANADFYATTDANDNSHASSSVKRVQIISPTMTDESQIFQSGTVIAVRTTFANTRNNSIKINIVDADTDGGQGCPVYYNGAATSTSNPFLWDEGATIYFRYSTVTEPHWEVISGAGVNQLLVNTQGITGNSFIRGDSGFRFSLVNNAFQVGPVSNNTFSPVLTVNKDGLKVKGEIEATKLIITNDVASSAGIATKSYVEDKGYVNSLEVTTIITPTYIKTNLLEVGGWRIYDNSLGILTTRGSNYYGIIFDNYAFTNASRAFAIGKIGYGLTTDKYQKADEYQKALLKGETDWGAPNFQITYDGTVTANNIIAKGGYVGDWHIETLTLTSSDKYKHTYTGSCLYALGQEKVDSTTSEDGWAIEEYGVYLTPDGIYTRDTMGYYNYKSWFSIMHNL